MADKRLKIPVLTTAQRNALVNPAFGDEISNSDDLFQQYYDGSDWQTIVNKNFTSTPEQIVYVSNLGDNAAGGGTPSHPFLTIDYALGQISDNSSAKPYLIECVRGNYSVTNLLLKDFIDIEGNNSTLTIINPIDVDATFSDNGVSEVRNFISSSFNISLDFITNSITGAIVNFKNIEQSTASTYDAEGTGFDNKLTLNNCTTKTGVCDVNLTDCSFKDINSSLGSLTASTNIGTSSVLMHGTSLSSNYFIIAFDTVITTRLLGCYIGGDALWQTNIGSTTDFNVSGTEIIGSIIGNGPFLIKFDELNATPALSSGAEVAARNIVLTENGTVILQGGNTAIGGPTSRLGNLWADKLNGISPMGGVFLQTLPCPLITATTVETTLMGTGVGSLFAPANTLQISAFIFVIAGGCSMNNGDTLTIRLKTNGTIDLGTIVVTLDPAVNQFYEIELDISLTALGGPGVGEIITNFDFTYNKNIGNEFVGQREVFINNTTVDSTVDNTFSVTAQFSSASASNSLISNLASMTRTY